MRSINYNLIIENRGQWHAEHTLDKSKKPKNDENW